MITLLAAPIGFLLGVFFYGGLWLTVKHLVTTNHPVLLGVGSFWLRLFFVLAGFLALAQGRWQNAVLCLAGFIAGRIAISRWVRCT